MLEDLGKKTWGLGMKPTLSGIMGNQRLTFFIISGVYRDYTTPKRLKVTYSTTRKKASGFGALVV